MRFFHPPKKLIEIVKNSSAITKEVKTDNYNHNLEWYFSENGKTAYNNAKTIAQKTKYFFDYLYTVAQKPVAKKKQDSQNQVIIYKVAYIMANFMDNSSLEFAGYPNIIDPEKNPLIKTTENFLCNTNLSEDIVETTKEALLGLKLLAALHGTSEDSFVDSDKLPYTRLTYCKSNDKFSDMYKIERYIIGAFECDFSETNFIPPYLCYNVVYSDERLSSVQAFIEANKNYELDPDIYEAYDELYELRQLSSDRVSKDDENQDRRDLL